MSHYGKDLTHGNIFINLFRFSWPLLVGNLLQVLYSTVDTIWVGHMIGKDALGAVSVSAPIIFMLIAFINGLAMASTVLVSQFAGARDQNLIYRTINNSMIIIGISAVLISIIGFFFGRTILIWMNTPDEVIGYATGYLKIYFTGTVFVFGYNLFSAILRGLGDSKTPLIFLLISTVTNIILDPLFIGGIGPFPKLGIQGAALATIISQAIAFVFAFCLLKRRRLLNLHHFQFDRSLTLKTLHIGVPSGIQQMIVSLGLSVLTSVINGFGTVTLSAFGSASKLDQFANLPSQSFSLAVSTMTGQAIGADKKEKIKEVYRWGMFLSFATTFLVTIFVMVFPKLVLELFTTDEEVIRIGTNYLHIVGFSYVPFALLFITNGILRGAGDTVPTMIFSLVSLWIIRVPMAIYLSSFSSLGSNGIWLAITLSSVITLILSQSYYFTGRWKRKTLIKRRYTDEEELAV